MNAPKPLHAREPDCIHSGWYNGRRERRFMQPASACRICKDGPELAQWKDEWAAWLAENPDSYEARWVKQQESVEGRTQPP